MPNEWVWGYSLHTLCLTRGIYYAVIVHALIHGTCVNASHCLLPDALGSAGQVLVAQYIGLARDARKASGAGRSWSGDALRFRESARSIAKRVLTLSLGLGITLATAALNLFPAVLPSVCHSKEVAQLVSNVREPLAS